MPTDYKNAEITEFLPALLSLAGLKRGIDYTLKGNNLRIPTSPKSHFIKKRLQITLKELYPEYSYYWLTPSNLQWF